MPGAKMYRMYGIPRKAGEQSLVLGRMSLVKRLKKKHQHRWQIYAFYMDRFIYMTSAMYPDLVYYFN